MLGRLVAFLPTVDLDRSHRFCAGVLGLRRVEQTCLANAYDVAGPLVRVTLVDRLDPAPYTILGFQVGGLAAQMTRLERRGVRFIRYPHLPQAGGGVWTAPSGSRIAWFHDPDGNVLSLQEPGASGAAPTSAPG
jgi:catechol 2,3-dioxygenase-like lactoylglutathione lyase family enzyme